MPGDGRNAKRWQDIEALLDSGPPHASSWRPLTPLSTCLDPALTEFGRPIAAYVHEVAATESATRVTVLIPEPERLWQGLLQKQRGAVVAHAVRRDTDAAICRLRFRLLWAGSPLVTTACSPVRGRVVRVPSKP